MHSTEFPAPRKANSAQSLTLRLARSSTRVGRSAAVYSLVEGGAVLLHRTAPRGILIARAFAWGRGAGRAVERSVAA
jgi:hypothetical protein